MFAATARDLKWTVPNLIRLVRTVRANKNYKIYYIIEAPYYDKFAFNFFFQNMFFQPVCELPGNEKILSFITLSAQPFRECAIKNTRSWKILAIIRRQKRQNEVIARDTPALHNTCESKTTESLPS